MCCWHQWFEDSWVSVLRDSRFLVNGGSNLYNMKTNLHPFDEECYHRMRTITALDKLRLRESSSREI